MKQGKYRTSTMQVALMWSVTNMDVSFKRLWLFIVVNNNESYVFRLSHDDVTCDVDRDVSTAYCQSSG